VRFGDNASPSKNKKKRWMGGPGGGDYQEPKKTGVGKDRHLRSPKIFQRKKVENRLDKTPTRGCKAHG